MLYFIISDFVLCNKHVLYMVNNNNFELSCSVNLAEE